MITVGQARNDDAILAAAARDRNDPAIIRAIDRGQRILLGWGNWADTVQELTDKAIAAVDKALEAKQAEIMQV